MLFPVRPPEGSFPGAAAGHIRNFLRRRGGAFPAGNENAPAPDWKRWGVSGVRERGRLPRCEFYLLIAC